MLAEERKRVGVVAGLICRQGEHPCIRSGHKHLWFVWSLRNNADLLQAKSCGPQIPDESRLLAFHAWIGTLRLLPKSRWTCPACGYDNLLEIPWSDSGPSDEICPSCGIQFGYDDAAGGNLLHRQAIYVAWRERWQDQGMQWYSSSRPKPPGWDPRIQVRRVVSR
jgi:hypothetical protein